RFSASPTISSRWPGTAQLAGDRQAAQTPPARVVEEWTGMSSPSSLFQGSGPASGPDTKTIIAQIPQIEPHPPNIVQGQPAAHTSKMAAIQSIKDQIASLQGAVAALADRSKMNSKIVSTDTLSTSPSVLSATATADAINGTVKVTVSQLATSTRVG